MLKKSYLHRGGVRPLLGVTIPEHFAAVVANFGDREAVVSLPQERRLSYKELDREIDRLAAGLLAMGFGRGDRVGIWSTNIVNVETGSIVPRGEVGEICFRGYHLMKGYYGDEEATRQVIDQNGWLHSGDLGTMDEDGYVSITGRLKNMIIRGGENIYPSEIEDVIFTHPKVSQVAVFGIPDEYYGEEVAAWIQLHAGDAASSDDIREFCKGKLAHFKIPRYIEFVDEFPMTVTGKSQKFRMRELTIEALRHKREQSATA